MTLNSSDTRSLALVMTIATTFIRLHVAAAMLLLVDGISAQESKAKPAFTFNEVIPAYTAGDWWFYVPKGTTTLDLQYSTDGTRNVTIYKRSGSGFVVSRGPLPLVDAGVKRVPLTPDEVAAGCLASFTKAPPPYFYSIPSLWAKSQSQLLVPRKIAERDGLTILP